MTFEVKGSLDQANVALEGPHEEGPPRSMSYQMHILKTTANLVAQKPTSKAKIRISSS